MNLPLKIDVVSTYPPRRCGIATFAFDLATAVASGRGETLGGNGSIGIIAMSERARRRHYGPEVRYVIRALQEDDYIAAADFVNAPPTQVVSLQHEYGIFGGRTGHYILKFLEYLREPLVTTLHTVLAAPTREQREVLRLVCSASAIVVVQAAKAVEFLADLYDVPPSKVRVIPHGTPDVPASDPAPFKKGIGAEGRQVLLTFGLISPRKGIQVALRALADIAARFPSVLYIVLGQTHPTIKKRYGEGYRESLKGLVERFGLQDNVRFVNRFVDRFELLDYLRAADLYLSPYLNEDQISSGTLADAVACGRATISTPYWFARELLADGRGVLVGFRDWRDLAAKTEELLADDEARLAIARRAYEYGRGTTWAKAAASYERAFREAAADPVLVRPREIPPPAAPPTVE